MEIRADVIQCGQESNFHNLRNDKKYERVFRNGNSVESCNESVAKKVPATGATS